jgi:propionyl-CoA synthetase
MANAGQVARARSLADPVAFWGEAASLIDWETPPEAILDGSSPPLYRWFRGARLNTCANALDRHVVRGHGERIALIHDSAYTGLVTTVSYAELLDRVARFAGALRRLGVERGDRVIIYLPMVPEALIAMLACARLGAVHSVVFGGFAPPELAARIDDAQPRAIITASCGIEAGRIVPYKPLVDEARRLATHQTDACVVLQRPELTADMTEGDIEWDDALSGALPVDPVAVEATDPLYILYTSGTTGKPKGIVRDNGGHAVAMAWSLPHVYGIGADDVWWAASDVGWVVGHSYIVYAPLITGCTTVMFEGKPVGTPDSGAFWRIIEQHRVAGLFTAPTAIRAIKKEDPHGERIRRHDLSSLRTLFLAGERLDPDTYAWATDRLGVPVVDNWWQTETGWPIASSMRGLDPLPLRSGSPSTPVPGYDVRVLDDGGAEVPDGVGGNIAIRLPLPPGALPTLWGDDERYIAAYLSEFPGFYATGDGGHVDADGYLYVMGRTDDVINVAGHRLTTGSLEAAVSQHPAVAECAVIGVHDDLKGQVPKAFVVLKAGLEPDPMELQEEIVALVRSTVGPVAALREVRVVPGLPKTRSGKILRRSMRAIADGRDEPVPSTIEDPQVLTVLAPMLRGES